MIANLNSGNFSTVLSMGGDIVVLFLLSNDGACQSYISTVKNAVANSNGLSFGSIAVDRHPEIARANQITNLPTINTYRDGQLLKQIPGIYSSDVLTKAFGIIYTKN